MNNVTLTINLSADDRARLDRIIEILEQPTLPRTAPEIVQRSKPVALTPTPIEEIPKKETSGEEPTTVETMPSITESDIRAMVMTLIKNGKKDEAKAIVNEYAASISDITATDRPIVHKRLTALSEA